MTNQIPSVILTAYNLGQDATEKDFNQWVSYVSGKITELCGFTVEVDSFSFTGKNSGGPNDDIYNASDEQKVIIQDALRELWDIGCADNFQFHYKLSEDGQVYDTILAKNITEALNITKVNFDKSAYSNITHTIWVDIRVVCVETEETEYESFEINPTEPKCVNKNHRFLSPYALVGGLVENPGIHGNGGGVIITEVCRHCGCKKITDTWAQRMDTGEQGLKSIGYEEEAFSGEELSAVDW